MFGAQDELSIRQAFASSRIVKIVDLFDGLLIFHGVFDDVFEGCFCVSCCCIELAIFCTLIK